MPRPCHCRRVAALPKMTYFKPRGVPMSELAECRLSVDGLEALRLADYQDLNMDEAAARMGVSRHTFGRLLRKARRCVAEALIEGHALRIEGGVCALVDTSETQGALDMSQSILWLSSDAPGGLKPRPAPTSATATSIPWPAWKTGPSAMCACCPTAGMSTAIASSPYRNWRSRGSPRCWPGAMGMRPLSAMQAAGVTVYHNAGQATVGDALKAFAAGNCNLGTSSCARAVASPLEHFHVEMSNSGCCPLLPFTAWPARAGRAVHSGITRSWRLRMAAASRERVPAQTAYRSARRKRGGHIDQTIVY